ncbi:ShKT domain-containing protein [Caenorhabditis elegans]|uniref:ShKT domain-containing protein n=1 Tax=Caenorhabditis elegans TaxID=6239 RepID=Q9XUS8_CAEEL|nr:ShKT domain-containing protein [Caenorhabditis elegans]CAB04594.1 ShKT domain-containing protein [Caenorhabditis elegans]|eukprot:NP_499836.1 TYRosinase [Caenorhabditis elegans]
MRWTPILTTLLLLCVVLISVAGVKSTTKKGAVGGTAVRKTTVKKVAVKNKNIQRMNQKRWREPPRDCSDAPKHLKQTCLMIRRMDLATRRRLARQSVRQTRPNQVPNWLQPIPVPANARGQAAYHPYDCMTLLCLCPFFNGRNVNGQCVLSNGVVLNMSWRKEYRMMTEDERRRWHNALNTLKRNGEYDRLSRQHLEVGVGSGAHSGPGFLPWHREYLKRVEIALRMVDPTVFIPYWDSVMDSYLPDPRDSIMFSDLFVGGTDYYGNVVTGPFAYWRTIEGRSTILRNLGAEGQLFNENQVNTIVAQNTIENTLAYTAPQPGCPYPNNYGAIEYSHSNIHLWIGGDMKPPSTSANEPIFFMHHSFVDYLWELWRQLQQPRWLREQAYSADHPTCANWQHFSYAPMRPFPYLVNRDGLSNSYTDQMYRYAPRATCSHQRPNCGSPYLFCDTRGYPHCVSKIRLNGNCRGFEQNDACYASRCWWGRCVNANFAARMKGARTHANSTLIDLELAKEVSVNGTKVERVPLVKRISIKMTAPLFVDCYNRMPCCDSWAKNGGCQREPEFMSQYCQASCNTCTPSYNTTDACMDRHVNCVAWKADKMCSGKSADFMSENCRSSCGKCSLTRESQCFNNGKIIVIPVSQNLRESISDSLMSEVTNRIKKVKKVAAKEEVESTKKVRHN